MTKFWNIWKYSLGSFSDDKTTPYDNYVALIRTCIFVSYMVTNTFIISGVIRHWNNDTRTEGLVELNQLYEKGSDRRGSGKRSKSMPLSSLTNV